MMETAIAEVPTKSVNYGDPADEGVTEKLALGEDPEFSAFALGNRFPRSFWGHCRSVSLHDDIGIDFRVWIDRRSS